MKIKLISLFALLFAILIPFSSCTKPSPPSSSYSSEEEITSISSASSEIPSKIYSTDPSQTVVGDYILTHDPQFEVSVIGDYTYIYMNDTAFVMADCDTSMSFSDSDFDDEIANLYFDNSLASISSGNYENAKTVSASQAIDIGDSIPAYQAVFSVDRMGVPIYLNTIVFLYDGYFSTITFACGQDEYDALLPQFEEMLDTLS